MENAIFAHFMKESMHLKTGVLSDYQVMFLLLKVPQIETNLWFNRWIYDVRRLRHVGFALYLLNGRGTL